MHSPQTNTHRIEGMVEVGRYNGSGGGSVQVQNREMLRRCGKERIFG
jgi:hypothetical protein